MKDTIDLCFPITTYTPTSIQNEKIFNRVMFYVTFDLDRPLRKLLIKHGLRNETNTNLYLMAIKDAVIAYNTNLASEY
ncbi:hypothetical protein [Arcticibacter tournemirensis]